MISARKFQLVCWSLLLVGTSSAPITQEKRAPKQPALATARYNAALKQFDLIWQYYQQSRVESFDVYVWSRLLLDSKWAISDRPADRIVAFEEHLDRMKKLEALVKKVRRLGFGRSSDVGASEYYRIEAEYWLAEAQSG
jgi:hypothetical protein